MATVENKILLKAKSIIRSKCPWLFQPLLKLASRTVMFKAEREYLIQGKRENVSEVESVVLLSQPRGGTQICEQVISNLFARAGGRTLHLSKFLFWYGDRTVADVSDEKWASDNLVNKGYFFGNLGAFEKLDELPKLKYIVMCRDPRDVLLSHYFSVRDAHILNSEKMRRMSYEAQNQTVDEYVLRVDKINDVKCHLQQTILMRKSDHRHLFTRYEDMMENPGDFIARVAEFSGKILSATDVDQVLEQCGLVKWGTVQEESILRHRRSGAWGQFKVKLTAETQSKLWEVFKDQLVQLNYSKDSVDKVDSQ